ncbi:MAG TPA: hypothetical protein VKT72_09660 [Candidatus Baltobacteraceae bacterium]|nr:hypothetical protein [Candidatus Baltobacteraceae bacterium]
MYIGSGIVNGQLGKLLFGEKDLAGIMPMIGYYLRLRKEPPAYGDYNPLQKLAYTLAAAGADERNLRREDCDHLVAQQRACDYHRLVCCSSTSN